MGKLRIKKPSGDVVIPEGDIRKIREELGEEGVKLFRLLLELADENGQIVFSGTEEDMIEQIQNLYAARFGGEENGSYK